MAQLCNTITLAQLAEHDTPNSLWIAVHGEVYDLTTFRSDHPGGTEALENCAGTDGTEAYEYAGHSKSNMTKMKRYRIGNLEGAVHNDAKYSDRSVVGGPSKDSRNVTSKSWALTDRWKLVAISVATLLTLSLLCRWYDVFSAFTSTTKGAYRTHNSAQEAGQAFWLGLALASSLACVAAWYFHRMFLATLDYQNEVFSFPATIPKKSRV